MSMKKERMNRMLTIIVILLIIIGVVLIWFHIPYSPVKKEFSKDIEALKIEKALKDEGIKQLTFLGKVTKTVLLLKFIKFLFSYIYKIISFITVFFKHFHTSCKL